MLEQKLKNTPQKPGVYLLKDNENHILYVGKAKALRNRLRSHFKPGRDEEPRHQRMMSQVTDFEIIVTDSEVEALIMEANFVKSHRPKYNVNLKDDKSYPYIRVTKELYPRIFVTRKIIRDGSKYYGPYTDVQAVRQTITAIKKIFPIRTCQLNITANSIKKKQHRVCLMYHIKRCPGPCEGFISAEAYQHHVDHVTAFIEGKNKKLAREMERQMVQFAENRQYEEAAYVRDQLKGIQAFQQRQKVVDMEADERDIITVALEQELACGVVFQLRDGKIINRQHYDLENAEGKTCSDIVQAFLEQYYLRAEFIAKEIYIPEVIEDRERVESWLREKRGGAVRLIVPQRGPKAKLIRMATENARLLVQELRVQKEAIRISGLVEALQEDLGLEAPPLHIEAFDISHIQGSETVASLVVFENGKPKKSQYRKFKIKTVDGVDDFASIAEVVERRFHRLLEEKQSLPDLVVIDGGKGQLSAAVEVLEKFQLQDQPVIGLAKRLEEIFRPGISDPQTLPKSSPSLRLLQQVRDEAHRFAITFHRSLRQKRTLHSDLDDIPGIGRKRRSALLKHFGSIQIIRNASVEDIAQVDGMNLKSAEKVAEALKK